MTGFALHIGINYCNTRDAADCLLDGAVADARTLASITKKAGFESLIGNGGTLLESKAKADGIVRALDNLDKVKSGDTVVITFSGLGMPVDLTLPPGAAQRAWIAFDRLRIRISQLFDVLQNVNGAKILVVSAACFAGPAAGVRSNRLRAIPKRLEQDFAMLAESNVKALWKGKLKASAANPPAIFHLSASDATSTIRDGAHGNNSPFVAAIAELLDTKPGLSFTKFVQELGNSLDVKPVLEKFGNDAAFEKAGPFVIVPAAGNVAGDSGQESAIPAPHRPRKAPRGRRAA